MINKDYFNNSIYSEFNSLFPGTHSSLYLSYVIIPGKISGFTQFVPLAKILILFISSVKGGSPVLNKLYLPKFADPGFAVS
jgi:hypothetical protein